MDTKSKALFERAQRVIPGGVNSPVRACKSVGRDPLFIERAKGARVYDADGNGYLDYVGSWGPMILGHAPERVNAVLRDAIEKGTSFGAPTELEIDLAELVIDTVKSVDVVRMVNSGTEATMSAIRLARGFTGRDVVIKFDGCYHGHADPFLVAAGSGVATYNIAGSPGVPEDTTKHTLSIPYNDIDKVREVMTAMGDQVACIIVEGIAGNMGFIKPQNDFLKVLREETEKHGALLIVDEVMTGFRVALGGAQSLYGITPDLTTMGKIIGGGLPVGAYGGRADIMAHISPNGPVYQAGTLSGNPLAMAAGIETLKAIREPGFYEALAEKTTRLVSGLVGAAEKAGIPCTADTAGSMFGLYFTGVCVANFEDAKTSNLELFSAYYNRMLEEGVYLAPSQFEAAFVSAAHTDEDIDFTIAAATKVLAELAD
ncbi:glutamate-1-semialdehyde 2,1-aminomutase [Desulfoluna sp.]|uniref:glutamate-1-semialdehyde 2,1-aminomutase n=1 Tax=Desulfoluna sp. TaxID=2045199 RepID=UPI002610066F|nr:glutamate-1-semialdehyde 2,1-aminomutase [Desulfoluna sp.]